MKRVKYLLANVLIVLVVYSNCAVIIQYPLSTLSSRWSLPIPNYLHDIFLMFGVFSFYETTNRDIEIHGILAAPPPPPASDVIKLPAYEYFPFNRGEQQSRLLVNRPTFLYGTVGQQVAWGALSAKIRARHNRLHPESPVRAIGIVHVQWPRSVEGYEELKSHKKTKYSLLYAE